MPQARKTDTSCCWMCFAGIRVMSSVPFLDSVADRNASVVDGDGGQPLAGHGIGDGVLQGEGLAPLARGPHVAAGADLIEAPVDLQVVAVRVLELDGELATGAPPSFEVDGHPLLAQPGAGAEHFVQRPDLEGEVIERAVRDLRG